MNLRNISYNFPEDLCTFIMIYNSNIFKTKTFVKKIIEEHITHILRSVKFSESGKFDKKIC
jgi:hypothetical protein